MNHSFFSVWRLFTLFLLAAFMTGPVLAQLRVRQCETIPVPQPSLCIPVVPGFQFTPHVAEHPLCHVDPGASNTSIHSRAIALPPPVTDSDFHDGARPDHHEVTLGRFLFLTRN